MMRVGLDTTPLIGARTGVGQFTAGLVSALASRVEVVPFDMTWAGRRPGTRPLPARPMRAIWRHANWPPIEMWTGPVQIVHGTNYVVPPSRAPQIVSVHDLTAIHFPDMCTADTLTYPALIKRALSRGAHIHCDSHYVANEVITWANCHSDIVHVVAPGIPTNLAAPSVPMTPRFEGRPYLLVLGTIEPRKDHATALRAFAEVATRDFDLLLVVAGSDGWGTPAYDAALANLTPAVTARIIRQTDVTDTQRDELVAHARMLVYPSVYEGFGFPPLEAMAAGVPVVATNAGSLPEVLGDAACFVNVGDAESLTETILRIHTNESVRASLIAAGVRRASEYTWARCGEEMHDAYNATIGAS
jgi:glycosyltransferase involved in cell wall biosynthesis